METHREGSHRGMVTAQTWAEGRKTEIPVILNRHQAPEPEAGAVTRYVTDRGRFHFVKIVTLSRETAAQLRDRPPRESEDELLVRAALAYLPDGRIKFTDYAFGTPHRSVAAYLDARIRQGLLPGVARDSEQLRLRCALCNHTELNTPLGREKLLRHTIEAHPTDEDEYWEDDMPYEQTVPRDDDYDPTEGDRPGSKASATPTGDMHRPGDPADNDAAEKPGDSLPEASQPFGAAEQAQVTSDAEILPRGEAETAGPAGAPAGQPNLWAMKKDELIAELETAGLDPDDYANNEERVAALEKNRRGR